MATSVFKSFRSTVTPFIAGDWLSRFRMLLDPTTGAPVGIQSQNGGGPDGIWCPIDLTAAQIAAPTPAMLADINATYRINTQPYTRYYSNGNVLVEISASNVLGGQFGTLVVHSPLNVTDPAGLYVQGTIQVIT